MTKAKRSYRVPFTHRVKDTDNTADCWPFEGALDRDGYGVVYFEGKVHMAHRVAFFVANLRWPAVCYQTCLNHQCCNPLHLKERAA